MIFKFDTSLLNFILNKYDQVDIFAHYLDIPTFDIEMCISNKNKKINNPLRPDLHPSVGFQYNNHNKLIMKDFANSFYTGDCFYIVGIALGLNCNNPKHFIDICQHIDSHVNKQSNFKNSLIVINNNLEKLELVKNEMDITYREINNKDIKYFNQFFITPKQIELYFKPAQIAVNTINDKIIENYLYDVNDPCYVIDLGIIHNIHRYKLYFPKRRTGTKPRFRTNYTLNLEDIRLLGRNKNLIIQKSLKDEICLGNLLKTYNITNTDITRVSSESITLTQNEVNVLKARYQNIFTMFDNDKAGNVSNNIHREKYNFNPIYMTDLLKIAHSRFIPIIEKDMYSPLISKNISDFVSEYGVNDAMILTQTLIKHYL